MKKLNRILDYKILLVLCVFLVFTSLSTAQTISGPTSVVPTSIATYTIDNGVVYVGDSWIVTGGTQISSNESGTTYSVDVQWGGIGNGSITFKNKATVIATLAVVVENNSTPPTIVTEHNHVYNITPRVPTTDVTTLNSDKKIESITYIDGLGRPVQQVAIEAGGNSEDIITHIDYDQFGRSIKEYLPYSSSTDIGTYRVDALASTNTFYDAAKYNDDFPLMTTADINPYSEKELEASPLGRVFKQAAPGKDWAMGEDNEIEMAYDYNATNEVRYYSVTLSFANNTYTPTLTGGTSYYLANELYKTITKDENHDGTTTKNQTTEEFKDKQGRVLLKRTYADINGTPTAHDTYYVYDDYGNLTYVLPPKSEPQSAKPDATELSELCYQYKYDHKNRLVEKKIPGKGTASNWEEIVYNKLDQPVLTRDPNLKAQGKWLLTKYDAFGRVAFTGTTNNSSSRITLQNAANNSSVYTQYVVKTGFATTIASTAIYYTNTSIPHGVHEIHTINYYDNYTFDNAGLNLPSTSGGQAIINYNNASNTQSLTKGLPTGSKVRILGNNHWVTTVTGYDIKGRPIYIASKNSYLSTIDIVENKLDFTGKPIKSATSHNKDSNAPIVTTDNFSYDHVDRLLSQTQSVDGAGTQLIAHNFYDNLGQLKKKNVGGLLSNYQGFVNVTNNQQNNTLKSNANGWSSSGLGTDSSIPSGSNGYVEFTPLQTNKAVMVGLSPSNPNAHYTSIKYAIYARYDGLIRVYEYGSYRGTFGTYIAGDILRVEREGNTILYKVNGVTRYTSAVSSSGVLIGDVAFGNSNAYIKNLTLNSESNALQTVDYDYNIRGWLKGINNVGGSNSSITLGLGDLFGFQINYNSTSSGGGKLFNGNISQTLWKTTSTNNPGNPVSNKYTYTYDALNRITSGIDNTGNYNLNTVAYDKNGNITNLIRKGPLVEIPTQASHFGTMDNLAYTYASKSNELVKVIDASVDQGFKDSPGTGNDHWHDANGNMKQDNNKGIVSINYNHLNLPIRVIFSSTKKIDYTYDATGVKIKKNVIDGSNETYTMYAGNYIYEKVDSSNEELKFFSHPEGYTEPDGSDYNYVFQYKDHLGNIRLSYSDSNDDGSVSNSEIVEENNYYPFGLKHKGYNENVSAFANSVAKKFMYNGIEYEEALDLNLYEMEFRHYDPAIARFTSIDPVTHFDFSPYQAFDNNPVYWADPSGADSWSYTDDGVYKNDQTGEETKDYQRAISETQAFLEEEPPTDFINEDGELVASTNDGSTEVIQVSNKNVDKLKDDLLVNFFKGKDTDVKENFELGKKYGSGQYYDFSSMGNCIECRYVSSSFTETDEDKTNKGWWEHINLGPADGPDYAKDALKIASHPLLHDSKFYWRITPEKIKKSTIGKTEIKLNTGTIIYY